MPAELTFGDLHDAALRSVLIDWRAATAVFELLAGGGREANILVTGLRRFDCPREQPWGIDPHGTVYAARVRDETAPWVMLELEMQSGDVMTATGESIKLEDA